MEYGRRSFMTGRWFHSGGMSFRRRRGRIMNETNRHDAKTLLAKRTAGSKVGKNSASDSSVSGGGKNPAHAAGLVWLIVLLGLGTGVITLFAVRGVLDNIHEQRTRLAKIHDAADRLDNMLDRGFAEAHAQMQDLLALGDNKGGSPTEWLVGMNGSLGAFTKSIDSLEVAHNVGRMKRFLKELEVDWRECAGWSDEYRACQVGVAEKQKQIEVSLVRM